MELPGALPGHTSKGRQPRPHMGLLHSTPDRQCSVSLCGQGSLPRAIVSLLRIFPLTPFVVNSPPASIAKHLPGSGLCLRLRGMHRGCPRSTIPLVDPPAVAPSVHRAIILAHADLHSPQRYHPHATTDGFRIPQCRLSGLSVICLAKPAYSPRCGQAAAHIDLSRNGRRTP